MSHEQFVRDEALTRRSLLAQQALSCPATKAELLVPRAESASECWDNFFAAVASTKAQPASQRPFVVKVEAVGMVIEGRHGGFDLLHFPATGTTAAVDWQDDRFVALRRRE